MKRMLLWLLSLLVLALSSFSATANGGDTLFIKGCIIDKDKLPIPYTSVYLAFPATPNSIIKGVVTNEKGEFSLTVQKNTSYILKASYLGYKDYTSTLKTDTTEVNIGNVILEIAPRGLSDVVVKPQLQVTADKIIYNFEHDPARATSSIYEMLGKMPLIEIDPFSGSISVGHKGSKYIVLRKGRQDALFNFGNISFEELIKKLPAMGFTTFEIWTVVPIKYQEYDYVVNILPDPTQRLFGVVGSPEANYNFTRGNLGLGLGGNGSVNLFRFSAGVKYEYGDAPESLSEVETTFFAKDQDGESYYSQNASNRNRFDSWKTNFATSIDISKRQFINLSFDASFRDSKGRRLTETEMRTKEDVIYELTSNYKTKQNDDSWGVNATYELDFNKNGRSFNLSYLYSTSPTTRNDYRSDEYLIGVGNNMYESTNSETREKTHRIQLDYADNFLSNKLKMNLQAGYLIMDYDNEDITIDESTGIDKKDRYTRLVQDFQRIDGYASLNYNVTKKLNISSNLRVDYLPDFNVTKSYVGINEERIHQKELLLKPEGRITYKFKIRKPNEKSFDEMTPEEQMQYRVRQMVPGVSLLELHTSPIADMPNSNMFLWYVYSQRRPGIMHLTNYSDTKDPIYIDIGNPNLKPEADHLFYFGFSSWFINSLNSSFSFSNDKIVPLTTREGDKLVRSYYNSGKTRRFMVSLSHSFFKSKLRMSSSYSYDYADYGNDTWSRRDQFKISASYNVRFLMNLYSNLSLGYRKNFNSGAENYQDDIVPINLSGSINWIPKIFGQRFMMSLDFNDVLQWNRRYRNFHDMPDYSRRVETRSRGSLPITLYIQTTIGKFVVKPVRSARARAKIVGFSTDK